MTKQSTTKHSLTSSSSSRPSSSLPSQTIRDTLLDLYARFEPSYIQRKLGIPASTYSRYRQGIFVPSKKNIDRLVREGKNADRREIYNLAKRTGFTTEQARKVRSKSRTEALNVIHRVRKPERAVVPFKKVSKAVRENLPVRELPGKLKKIERLIKKIPTGGGNEKRKYLYDLARKTGLTAAESRDIRGWNAEKAEKYIIMREGGAMVMHARAAAEGSIDFVKDQNARYNRVAEFLSKKHDVPIEYIKRGMSINYSLERTVDDWEEYVKEKHRVTL
jgi:hypothetical protein